MPKAPVNWTNMLLFSITPAAALLLVPLYGFLYGYDLYEWLVFAALMAFSGLSITAGYHRLWSHKSYKAHPLLRLVFAVGGACALQNDVLHWASDHRRHHRYVDNNERDPYSAGRGFWFSHIGWMLRHHDSGRTDFSNVKDLQRDPIVRWQHRHYLKLALLTNIALPALLGLVHGDVLACLLLGGLLRLVLSQHVTYLINSAAHMWGSQPYSDDSSARDNPLLALITYGEGYHNYHHTFQWDYRNGARWWDWDPAKWMIRLCAWAGLARDLKRPAPAQVEAARLKTQYRRAAERCERLNVPESWRLRLEQEYQQLLGLLQQWTEHRRAWQEAKAGRIQEALERWDRLQLRDRYREARFRLKIQKQRWQALLRSLRRPLPAPA